jgi:glutamate-1-semialdehyde 2,1-aminomutase
MGRLNPIRAALASTRSEALFQEARAILVGGVNSPVRAFKNVGGTPRFIVRAQGPFLWDADGRQYIDYIGSWGASIFGAAHPRVVKAVQAAAESGFSFGAATEGEIRLGELVRRRMPSLERVRFVNSGTEATMSALRVARAATGRDRVLKFEGCYHGHADVFLSKAGSGIATLGIQGSAGVPGHVAADAITVPYNDIDAVEEAFRLHGNELAAVLVEPVAANMGVVPPHPGFLARLRELCDEHGALLIFDEVITGFRVAPGGAQERYGVRPDLTCLGKVLGGGLPIAGYGGRQEFMGLVAPEGPVYQAGTLAGNPLSVAGGLATLAELTPDVYERLEGLGARLERGISNAFQDAREPATCNRVGSLVSWFLARGPVADYASAQSDRGRFARWFHGLLDRGVHPPPSPFEAWFVSAAHTERQIDETVVAARVSMVGLG